MGTNFYKIPKRGEYFNDDMDPKFHIGKRSAAGMYCFDCGITLCKDGEQYVHYSEHEFYDACPKCGKKPEIEILGKSAVGRELGFNKSPFEKKTGVKGCSSFSFAMDSKELKGIRKVMDEYDRKFTIKEFKAMLDECPIKFYGSIGEWFC